MSPQNKIKISSIFLLLFLSINVSAQKPVFCLKKQINQYYSKLDSIDIQKDSLEFANTLLHLSELEKFYGNTTQSYSNVTRATSIFEALNNQSKLADCYKLLGDISSIERNIKKALEYNQKAYDIYKKHEEWLKAVIALKSLSYNYQGIKQTEKANDYLETAFQELKNHNLDTSNLLILYAISGLNHIQNEKYDKAIKINRKALKIKPKNLIQIVYYGRVLNNMSYIYRLLNKYDSAQYYNEKSLKFNKQYCFSKSLAVSYANKGLILYANKKYDSAYKYCTQSLKLAKKAHYNQIIQDNYLYLARISSKLEKYERTSNFITCYYLFRDSILRTQNLSNSSLVEAKLEENIDQNEEAQFLMNLSQDKIKAKESNYRINLYAFIILFLLIIIALIFIIARNHLKSKDKLKELNEYLEEKVIERTLNLSYEMDRHKKTAIELKQNEERWNKAQEVGKIGNWEYDLKTYNLWGSKQAFKIFGFHNTKDPVYTNHILHRIHPDDFKHFINEIKKVKDDSKRLHIEFRIHLPKAHFDTYILLRAEVIYNLNLEPIKISGTIQDVTNRKFVEKELIKAKEKAEESDRLKSAFLSNMSHEIRTPMNAIIGFSDLLADPSLKEDEKNQYINLIQSNSNKLMNLIDDIIDIAKIEANQIQIRESDIHLNRMLQELHKTFEAEAKISSLEFKLIMPEDPQNPIIKTDAFRLQQILTNLLTNAFKFTDKGSIEFGYTLNAQNQLEFYVKDTGIGISKESQQFIFERFRQVQNSNTRLYGGTGLGLAISKHILSMMGGEIWVESEKKEGSKFTFTLPFNETEIPQIKESRKSITDFNWEKKSLLIVEDEIDSFTLLERFLQKTKIKIHYAQNGREAVEMVDKLKKIDLIMMDIQMPEMNGLEATRIIKSTKKEIPIIAQTAFALPGEKQKCKEAGCDAYITKPINKVKLINLMNGLLNN